MHAHTALRKSRIVYRIVVCCIFGLPVCRLQFQSIFLIRIALRRRYAGGRINNAPNCSGSSPCRKTNYYCTESISMFDPGKFYSVRMSLIEPQPVMWQLSNVVILVCDVHRSWSHDVLIHAVIPFLRRAGILFDSSQRQRCGTAEIELPERSERGTLPAVATTVLFGFLVVSGSGSRVPLGMLIRHRSMRLAVRRKPSTTPNWWTASTE